MTKHQQRQLSKHLGIHAPELLTTAPPMERRRFTLGHMLVITAIVCAALLALPWWGPW